MYNVYNTTQVAGKGERLVIDGVTIFPARFGQQGPSRKPGHFAGVGQITERILSLVRGGRVAVFLGKRRLSFKELEELYQSQTAAVPALETSPETPLVPAVEPKDTKTPEALASEYTLELLQGMSQAELKELARERGLDVKLNLAKGQLAQEIFNLLGGSHGESGNK